MYNIACFKTFVKDLSNEIVTAPLALVEHSTILYSKKSMFHDVIFIYFFYTSEEECINGCSWKHAQSHPSS